MKNRTDYDHRSFTSSDFRFDSEMKNLFTQVNQPFPFPISSQSPKSVKEQKGE